MEPEVEFQEVEFQDEAEKNLSPLLVNIILFGISLLCFSSRYLKYVR